MRLRSTHGHFSAVEKIAMVLKRLCGEASIVEICRHEGIAPSMHYCWSTEFLESSKDAVSRSASASRSAPKYIYKPRLRFDDISILSKYR
jgi:transposase-like protein